MSELIFYLTIGYFLIGAACAHGYANGEATKRRPMHPVTYGMLLFAWIGCVPIAAGILIKRARKRS